ncbi:hypothetical protein ACFVU0_16375 [Streptomyces sp. NPDC058122]|uniref:hypothetical protein n=1 Tax=Streptomyces sp. NPDC058122 TaxID=3346349 RepID=UPI0036E8963F
MDTVQLFVLGAAGGSLRGLIDAYNQTMEWQSARREARSTPAPEEEGPPRFKDYFDLFPDTIAAVFHTALGAGAALLFGTSGQIVGTFAAIAVGVSAPALLTQLGQLQHVNEAVTGAAGTRPGAAQSGGAQVASGTGPAVSPPAPNVPLVGSEEVN